jgi:RNA polymerase subunit RPABC4/transcription elongation factor Spt4
MERRLVDILQKLNDFKVCKKCGRINWYENENCIECSSDEFDKSREAVRVAIENEYNYWINIEKYTEEEADNVIVDV